jgi:pyruvate-formate lyase-activating enzyme
MNIHETLRPITASVLPVAIACDAKCPKCFSRSSISLEVQQRELTQQELIHFLDFARQRGAQRAVISGGGEPLLYAPEKLSHLIQLMAERYPKVVMITNGARLADQNEEKARALWQTIAQSGLRILAISRAHWDDHTCAVDLGGLLYPFERLINFAHTTSQNQNLTLRLICLIQKGLVDDADDVRNYIEWAENIGVRQITFKELYVADPRGVYYSASQNLWSKLHRVPIDLILEFFLKSGTEKIDELAWGCPIFRYQTKRGTIMQIAAYWEPTQKWEQEHGICRSYNLLTDGKCYTSLEDKDSAIPYLT